MSGSRGVALGHKLGLKDSQPVTGNIQIQFTAWREHLLWAAAIAVVLLRLAFAGEMMAQLRCKHTLGQHLLELPSQAKFAKDRLSVLVLYLMKVLVNLN